jgi:hypothetical protein
MGQLKKCASRIYARQIFDLLQGQAAFDVRLKFLILKCASVARGKLVLVAHENKWMAYCFPIFFILLAAYGPAAELAHSQTQNPNALENKNILILNAFESNIPAFDKTDHGLSVHCNPVGSATETSFMNTWTLGAILVLKTKSC